MDEKDEYILTALRRNSRASFTKIAKGVGLSEGAVRKRVASLQKSGVIKRFTIESEKKGKIMSLMLVSVDTKVPNPSVAKGILDIPAVDRALELAGEYDLLVIFSGSSINEINQSIDKVRDIRGVEKTNTILVLKEWV